MALTLTECLLRGDIYVWEVKNVVFVFRAGTSTECLLRGYVYLWKVKMQCLYMAGTSTELPLRRGV